MQRFIVGTGRCGSTLLDNMMAHHPDLLVLSEFFSACDRARIFAPGELSGKEFAAILMRPNPHVELMGRNPANLTERPNSPWRANGGTPGPLMVTLPTLSNEPEPLFGEMLDVARRYPARPVGEHLQDIFQWLAKRLGKKVWLERSGASTEYLGDLRRVFADGWYVHVHRDAAESALSMRDHPFFVVFASYFIDPPSIDGIEATIASKAAAADDPMLRRVANKPSLDSFGRYWTHQVVAGVRELRTLPPERYLEIRYEDLLDSTHAVLQQIAHFFDIEPEGEWLDKAAAMVTHTPPRLDRLTAAERKELLDACYPGRVLLGQVEPETLEGIWMEYRRRICA